MCGSNGRRRPIPVLVLAVALLAAPACSGGGEDASTTTTVSTSTMATPTTAAPATTSEPTTSSTTTTTDPQLACLAEALGAHPELLEALGDDEASPADRLRAVLVARTCLPREQVHGTLAAAMRDNVPQDLSDYQADCLADLVLDLPDQDLATLLGVEPPATTGATSTSAASFATRDQIAARLLDLCGVTPA
jgi:hypothetical protein